MNDLEQALYRRQYQASTKAKVLALFGNQCKECGFDDPRALQIDHVNQFQFGEKWRSGTSLYRAIIAKKRTVEDLQCLCANCNWIKRAKLNETSRKYK